MVTGVTTGNRVDWDVLGSDYIDLDYENFWREQRQSYIDAGMDAEEAEEQADTDAEDLDTSGGVQLYGSWKVDSSGQYSPDQEGEFAAVYYSNDNYFQVIYSKHIAHCRLCSPCFPNQGDLDTAGQYATYTLPPDIFVNDTQL